MISVIALIIHGSQLKERQLEDGEETFQLFDSLGTVLKKKKKDRIKGIGDGSYSRILDRGNGFIVAAIACR